MQVLKPIWATFGFLIVGGLLTGCLDEKRGRITEFEPGVYKGKPDTNLTLEKRRELARRTVYQSGVTQVTGGGGGGSKVTSTTRSVRRPSDDAAFYSRLNARTANQKGN